MSSELAASKLLLFVLWYINIILILAILFVLVRNIFNLVLERHKPHPGFEVQDQAGGGVVLLSLLPVLIIFPMAAQILFESFEQWFALPIEDVRRAGRRRPSATSPREIQRNNSRAARRALEEVSGLDLGDLDQRPELQRTSSAARGAGGPLPRHLRRHRPHPRHRRPVARVSVASPTSAAWQLSSRRPWTKGVAVRIVDESPGHRRPPAGGGAPPPQAARRADSRGGRRRGPRQPRRAR